MSKYGYLAIRAAKAARNGVSPVQAWKDAAKEVFPDSASSREKGCPKSAFLGLAEEGLLRDILVGNYTRSKDNKRYALDAVSVIRANFNITHDAKELWQTVINGEDKAHNYQMDVVLALWGNGDISFKV